MIGGRAILAAGVLLTLGIVGCHKDDDTSTTKANIDTTTPAQVQKGGSKAMFAPGMEPAPNAPKPFESGSAMKGRG